METQKKIGRNSMSIRSRRNIKAVSLCVAAALAQMAAIQARADSGVGQDTTIGNALNARPINTSTHRGSVSPDGMGTNTPVARTPSGQMYDMPISPAEEVNKTEGGWEYFGHVEAGVIGLGGDKKQHGFRRYKDVDGGLYINNFGLTAEKKDSASFFEITGGSVAKDDQFYSMQFGRYNDWKLSAFLNETAHVFTTTYRAIHDGIGSGNLTLKPGLTAGGTAASAAGANADNASVAAVANANANTELGLVRTKGGVRLDMNLTGDWKLYASYTNEKRDGARPFGSVWGGGGGTAPVEIAEPIDYNSHDLMAGVQYADELNALNLQLSASWFRNNIGTLTFQSPYAVNVTGAAVNGLAATAFTAGQFDLYPNNDYYNIKAEYARNLPDFYKGRFTATTAFATSRQNDNLVPYTTQANINIANVTGGAGAENWHTTASLSKQSAGARIDTKLVNLGLALNPTDDLNVSGKLRYYETKNHTEYLACNPNATYVDNDPFTAGNQAGGLSAYGCTGVWGRLLNDGSGSSILMGANTSIPPVAGAAVVGNMNIRNIPFDYKQLIYGVTGDYRINQSNTVNLSYERETYKRDHRERDKTWEDKFKLTHVNRDLEDATLRWSFEHDRRRGSEYHTHHPYSPFYSGAIVPMPTTAGTNVISWVVHMNTGLRKYDLSDRDQNILNARVNYMLRPDLDMGIAAQLKDTKYPEAQFGRTDKQTQNSLNFDLTWQPSEERSVYGFYSYQQGKLTQRGNVSATNTCNLGAVINGITITTANAAQVCGMSQPGSTVWNSANAWAVKHKDDSDVIGFGWKEMFGEKRFDFNYNYARGKTAISYDLPGNIGAAPAGGGMPDLKTVSHVFEANLLIPVNKTVTSHLMLRHEIGKISDWHYTGLQNTPVAANNNALPTAVILDAGPQDYKASMLGVMFNFKM